MLYLSYISCKNVDRSVQQKLNWVDCGAFAVAFGTDLLFNISPDKRNYDELKFKSHVNIFGVRETGN